MSPIFLAALAAVAAPPAPIPAGPALTAAIAARDAEFFETYFLRCDPAAVGRMVMPDVEFYHDKVGVIARDAAGFVADYTRSCTAKQAPDAWRSRRALVPATLTVDPVPGFGAIETGEHLFYERRGGGPEALVGRARFVILWQWDGTWRISRALSFGHLPAHE